MEPTGWFYDLQTDITGVNRLTSISLHANSIPHYQKDSKDVLWKYVGDAMVKTGKKMANGDDEYKGYTYKEIWQNPNLRDKLLTEKEWGPVDEDGYLERPLCTAILNEEFNVNISNAWSDVGEDMIGGLYNQLRTVAPFAGEFIKGLNNIIDESGEALANNKEVQNSVFAKTLVHIASKARNFVNGVDTDKDGNTVTRDNGILGEASASDYLNRALVTQAGKYSLYNGTNVTFQNLTMKFTVFPYWDENGKFISVNDQLTTLYPYIIGAYVPEENLGSRVAERIGWQKPPGGYQSSSRMLDEKLKGTLKVKFGTQYSITNVVAENVSLNFSKQAVKNPICFKEKGKSLDPLTCIRKYVNGAAPPPIKQSETWKESFVNDHGINGQRTFVRDYTIERAEMSYNDWIASQDCLDYLTPLYCEVQMTLRPASKYSDVSLKDFVTGRGMINEKTRVTDELSKNLSHTKESLEYAYKTYNGDDYYNLSERTGLKDLISTGKGKVKDKIKDKVKNSKLAAWWKKKKEERRERKTARVTAKANTNISELVSQKMEKEHGNYNFYDEEKVAEQIQREAYAVDGLVDAYAEMGQLLEIDEEGEKIGVDDSEFESGEVDEDIDENVVIYTQILKFNETQKTETKYL